MTNEIEHLEIELTPENKAIMMILVDVIHRLDAIQRHLNFSQLHGVYSAQADSFVDQIKNGWDTRGR